jgi:hypothetical protein
MNIINTVIFWFLLGAVGGLLIAFVIGGREGGSWAAGWFLTVAIVGFFYVRWFQKRNP